MNEFQFNALIYILKFPSHLCKYSNLEHIASDSSQEYEVIRQ